MCGAVYSPFSSSQTHPHITRRIQIPSFRCRRRLGSARHRGLVTLDLISPTTGGELLLLQVEGSTAGGCCCIALAKPRQQHLQKRVPESIAFLRPARPAPGCLHALPLPATEKRKEKRQHYTQRSPIVFSSCATFLSSFLRAPRFFFPTRLLATLILLKPRTC